MSGETRNTARGVAGELTASWCRVPGRTAPPPRCAASQHPGNASHWFDAAPRRTLTSASCPFAVSSYFPGASTPEDVPRRRATLVPPHPAVEGFFLPGPPLDPE